VKINISRQHIYLLTISLVLLIFVILFSFTTLIPAGKEYRIQKSQLKKELKELRKYQDFSDETFEILKNLQSENRHIITAFDTIFDVNRFQKQHKSYFTSFNISKIEPITPEEGFAVYEVNTTSQISSPGSFYDFLDAVNKSDWIIDINFPIDFKREGELIKSSFTMKVYSNNRNSNAAASESLQK
jgi:hypothetical protein